MNDAIEFSKEALEYVLNTKSAVFDVDKAELLAYRALNAINTTPPSVEAAAIRGLK